MILGTPRETSRHDYDRCDFHVHTCCSPDSPADPDQVCQAATREGLGAIAITDHVDCSEQGIGFQGPNCRSYRQYRETIENLKARYQGSLTVLLGVEIGYRSNREDEIRAFLEEHPFEFTIGSIHESPPLDWWYLSCGRLLDTRPDLAKKSLAGYYKELRRAAESGLFTAIGHIDVYERYFPGKWPDVLSDGDLAPLVHSAVAAIARHSRMELNLAMLGAPGHLAWSALPLLRMYREMGGRPPTLGSDSHRPEGVGLYMEEGERLVREAGFASPADWREIRREA